MSALSNSFLRSILLFLFNQVFLLSGKFSIFKMFVLNKTIKCEGMRMNSPFSFLIDETILLNFSSSSFQGQFIQKKSRFFSQQPNEQWMLSLFKWQRVFLAIPLLSSGPTFPTLSSSFFSLPLTLYPLCVKNIHSNYYPSFSIHSLLLPSFVCFKFKPPPQNQWGLFMCFSVNEFLIEFILIILVFVECVSWTFFV